MDANGQKAMTRKEFEEEKKQATKLKWKDYAMLTCLGIGAALSGLAFQKSRSNSSAMTIPHQ